MKEHNYNTHFLNKFEPGANKQTTFSAHVNPFLAVRVFSRENETWGKKLPIEYLWVCELRGTQGTNKADPAHITRNKSLK